LFVATLGASSYTSAQCTRDQQMESWLRMHVRAFEHFGGIPALAVRFLRVGRVSFSAFGRARLAPEDPFVPELHADFPIV